MLLSCFNISSENIIEKNAVIKNANNVEKHVELLPSLMDLFFFGKMLKQNVLL